MKITNPLSLLHLLYGITSLSFLLIGCSTAVKHPTLKQEPLADLIPLNGFYNADLAVGYTLSPDGKKLAWVSPSFQNLALSIHVKDLETGEVEQMDSPYGSVPRGFYWLADSERIIYIEDDDGNENHHLFMVDINHPDDDPIELTPGPQVRVYIQHIFRNTADSIVIGHNQRDSEVFDLYRLHLDTLEQELIAQNPGDVIEWITNDGVLKGRIRRVSEEKNALEWYQPKPESWKLVLDWGIHDDVSIIDFLPNQKDVYLFSNVGRDRVALMQLNPLSGEQRLIYEDPLVDLAEVLISDVTHLPLYLKTYPDYPKFHFFDAQLESELQAFRKSFPYTHMELSVESADRKEQRLVIEVSTEKVFKYYLFDRKTRESTLLHEDPMHEYEPQLSEMHPISLKSRDGLTLHGYLTIPKGSSGKHLPTVLNVHGGPWARDYWGFNRFAQILANRGYAVLQINYRGSTGYGKQFTQAAAGEFGAKMHDDLIDAVQWAIEQGISDPEKVAIFGGSYGGYATLVGLSFTPNTFACGVNAFGVSDLEANIRSVPPYWKFGKTYWHHYVGNPDNPEDQKIMKAKSPLYRADQIQKPLLVVQGGNDPRVPQVQSDQIVAAMEKQDKDVEYLLFPDEGHGVSNPKNGIVFLRTMEDFLAECLGGRSAGWDYYELIRLIPFL